MPTCPSCGRESERTSLFCRHCGTRLAESPTRREQRKTVTILVCDLVHSTGLAEGDPEAFRRVQSRYFERMRGIVERHGGTVEKFVGDEVMAVFGVPTAHEDDALRAVRAADEMQRELSALSDELDASLGFRLRARVGINTGEVLAGDPEEGHGFVAGEAVIVAKRLQQAAEADTILIGDATYALVEHAVDTSSPERIAVKGKEDAVGARILKAVRAEAPGVARRLHTPMVGRDPELARLQGAFERTVGENSCRLVTVVGPAGIGKSRLATEFLSWIEGRAFVATGRCLSYGEGITLWPLSEILRDLGGETSVREALEDDDARDAILQALPGAAGAGEVRALEETFWAVRRAFQALARRGPLVVCFEDLHWAEPAMLDLVEYVVAWSREAPILVLALGRPELAEQRPQWIAPRPDGDTLTLEPLSSEAAESLLVDASTESLAPEMRRRIVSAAEGNPLFVEQMGAMVAEKRGGGKVSIPPSIQALLTERLDRLGPDERDVIERASIVGRDFPAEAVAALMPGERQGLATPYLFALVRKGLMRPEPSTASDEDRFGFQHALVREAAYEGMSKEFRAALHERFANWLEKPGRGQELDEVVGYHLERAHRSRLEVGVVDEHTLEVAARAGELLAAAGSRALGRNDVHAAQNLLARAVGLLPDGEPAVERKIDLCLALFLSGDFDAAAAAARDTAAHAIEAGDKVGELRARIMQARIAAQQGEDAGGEEPSAALLEVAEEARPVFTQAGNELALAEAWFATAWAQLIRCQWAAMLDAVLQALAHARNAGSARWEGELPAWLGTAMFYGPTPVEQALRWFEDQQAQHPIPLTQQAMLEAMRGNFDVARTIARAADTAAIEFGQQLWLPAAAQAMWQVETLAGDVTAAEVAARRSCELLEALGDVGYRGVAVSQLAWSLCSLGRFDEAIELTQTAEALSASDDVAAQMLWRQARGRILARRGDHEKAERLAGEAVALAEKTDMVNFHADALVDSAEISALAGRKDDASLQLEQALALYEPKGNLVAAASARRELRRLTSDASVR